MGNQKSIPEISRTIREEAVRLGFTDCGFSRAEVLKEDTERLGKWLKQGYHAGMGYMANHFEKRTDPTRLVEGARTVISLLYNYYTERKQTDPEAPVLSKYAYGRDYHLVMKERMYELFDYIKSLHSGATGRVFVDSAPVLERSWAQRAGLGWIGKNSSLISRCAGSFLFIGEIILNLELDYNTFREEDHCGTCTRCIDACPTGAILDNRTLDAKKCISYQTIENKGEISSDLEGKLNNRIFGCDICQDVCPWNKKALQHREPAFDPHPELLEMTTSDWNNLDHGRYQHMFRDSPLQRAGYDKIKRTLRFIQE